MARTPYFPTTDNIAVDAQGNLLIKGSKVYVNYEGNEVEVSPSSTTAVAASRALISTDNGNTLECTVADLTLTVPAGLPPNFGCAVILNGTNSFASSGGTLLNGSTSTVTRAAANNAVVAIVARSATDSYVVTGA